MAVTSTTQLSDIKLVQEGASTTAGGVEYADVVVKAVITETRTPVLVKGVAFDTNAEYGHLPRDKFRTETEITKLVATLGPEDGGLNFPRFYGQFGCIAPMFDKDTPALCASTGTSSVEALYLVTELLPITYADYAKQLTAEQLAVLHDTMFQQLACTMQCAYDKIGFVHGDLRTDNLMLKPTTLATITYNLRGTKQPVATNGILVVLIDFGESSVKTPWQDLWNIYYSTFAARYLTKEEKKEPYAADFFSLYQPPTNAYGHLGFPTMNIPLVEFMTYRRDPTAYLATHKPTGS